MLQIELAGEVVDLLPSGALYSRTNKRVFIADLHVGKANHFRKSGIPIPLAVQQKNIDRLLEVIQQTSCEHVYFLGDLFHSVNNLSWEVLTNALDSLNDIEFHLVKGNHDILDAEQYSKTNLTVHEEGLIVDNFELTHHPMDHKGLRYRLCGHIHPAVRLKGKGRQGLRLKCFWQTEYQMILPAFGGFTGKHTITPIKSDRVFVCTDTSVTQV